MTLDDNRRIIDEPLSWLVRLKRARLVLGAAALVFLALEVTGLLAVLQALVGFLIVAAASLIDFTGVPGPRLLLDLLARGQAARLRLAGRGRGVRPARRRDRARPPRHRGGVEARARQVAPALIPRRAAVARSTHPRRASRRCAGRRRPARPSASSSSRRCRPTAGRRPSSCRWRSPRPSRAAQAGARDAARSHAAQARRGDARRLRRQCEPRAAHAAGVAVGLHRDAAGLGAQRRAGARALPRHHEGAGQPHGAPDRRPPVAVADRAQGACAARHQVDLAPIVRQVADGLQPLARDRGVEVKIGCRRSRSSCAATATS